MINAQTGVEMAEFDNIKAGLNVQKMFTVDEKMTVSHLNTPVLSTPMMIGLMETVCKDLTQPLLPSGYTTVGYEVHVRHKSRAHTGSQIRVWAKLLEADGRKLLFEVRVSEGQRTVGEGLHRRTIVPVAE